MTHGFYTRLFVGFLSDAVVVPMFRAVGISRLEVMKAGPVSRESPAKLLPEFWDRSYVINIEKKRSETVQHDCGWITCRGTDPGLNLILANL